MEGNLLTIIFGLTSGILTLVGITSIFISINSQHNIQKVRELIWGITSLPLEANNYTAVSIAEKMCQYYWLYKDIVGTSKNFTKNIIYLSWCAIGLVCLFWVSLLYFSPYVLYIIAVGLAVVILILYSWAIGKLNDITEIADLPEYNKLLDGNSYLRMNIHIPALAAYGATITVKKRDDFNFNVVIGTNLPFFNLQVDAIISARNFKTDYIEVLEEKVIFLDGKGSISIGIPNLWYDLTDFNLNNITVNKIEAIDFQLTFLGCNRISIAHYVLKKQILKELKRGEIFSLLPEVVDNNFVFAKDGNGIPWGLNE